MNIGRELRGESFASSGCRACARHYFYPRSVCPHCGSTDVEWTTVSGKGRLHTFLISHRPAQGFEDDAPYAIAVVELEEGSLPPGG